MKILSLIILCLCIARLHSQVDSAGRYLSAIQVDVGSGDFQDYPSPTQQQLREIVGDNKLLNVNVHGFTKQNGGIFSGGFFGMTGFKLFFHESKKVETFAGLRYGQTILALTSYNLSNGDTIGTFNNNGATFFIVDSEDQILSYSVVADRIFVPFGVSVFTNQRRVFWVSASAEFCPFINFSYRFESFFQIVQKQEIIGGGTNSQTFNNNANIISFEESQSINGYSAGAYFAIPVALHIHPFNRDQKVPGRFHFLVSVLPLAIFNSSQFWEPVTSFSAGANVGLRYHFR